MEWDKTRKMKVITIENKRWIKRKKNTIPEYAKGVALPPAPAPPLPPPPLQWVHIVPLPPLQRLPIEPPERRRAPLQPLQPRQQVGWTGVSGVRLLAAAPDSPVPAGCVGVPPTCPVTTLRLLPPLPQYPHGRYHGLPGHLSHHLPHYHYHLSYQNPYLQPNFLIEQLPLHPP